MLNSTQLSSFGNGGCFSTANICHWWHLSVFWKVGELNQQWRVFSQQLQLLLCPVWNVDRDIREEKRSNNDNPLIRVDQENRSETHIILSLASITEFSSGGIDFRIKFDLTLCQI